LGFSIVTLWSAFLVAQADVGKEADALLMSFRLSQGIPQAEEFRHSLVKYVQSIKDSEWKEMDRGFMCADTQQCLNILWKQYYKIRPQDPNDYTCYSNLGNYLGIVSKLRLARMLLIKGNLYPPTWVIIIFGFLGIVFVIFFTNIQQVRVKLIIEFIVVFMVSSCIFFIYDLNTPFSGLINVPPDAFEKVYEAMSSGH
jgi:hypothetical protein